MRPKHITIGHVMRRHRCGLTEATRILSRMIERGQAEPVHSPTNGKLLYYRDCTQDDKS